MHKIAAAIAATILATLPIQPIQHNPGHDDNPPVSQRVIDWD